MDSKKVDNYSKRKLRTEEEKDKLKEGKHNISNKIKSSQSDITLLIKGLSDKNGLIRRNYAEAIAKIGKEALPELINALLNSKSVIQRRAAAKTLKLV